MLSQEQGFTKIDGVVAFDLMIVTQLVDKLLKHGLVTGLEVAYVAALRQKAVLSIRAATGVDIDNPASAAPSACNVPLKREMEV